MGCINSTLKSNENEFTTVAAAEEKAPTTPIATDRKVSIAMKQKRAARQREIVFGETIEVNAPYEKLVIPKSDETKVALKASLNDNFLFMSIAEDDITEMVDAMTSKMMEPSEIVIKEGDAGDYFYVVESGVFSVVVNEEVVSKIKAGGCFGELALLYNSPRAATIQTVEGGTLWALDRTTFRRIIARTVANQVSDSLQVLKGVPLLQSLTEDQLGRIAEAIEIVSFHKGEKIIKKGEVGNVLYIVKSGSVVCSGAGTNRELENVRLGAGEYFGERALMTNEPRAANVVAEEDVTAFALDRQSFDELLGPLHDLIDRNMGIRVLKSVPILTALSENEQLQLYNAFEIEHFTQGQKMISQGETGSTFYVIKSGSCSVEAMAEDGETRNKIAVLSAGEYFGEMALLEEEPRKADVIATTAMECMVINQQKFEQHLGPLQDIMNREAEERKQMMVIKTEIAFEDLQVLRTLGTGTFGSVKLTKHKTTGQVYALKVMQKAKVVAYKQKDNVVHEKNILAMCNHPFILKLHQTFKDKKNLYLLIELVQGGELFTYLHGSQRMVEYVDNAQARFYASNVLLALDYLHDRNILYRDLKPENLLIDHEGYIKVVDFGFAKIVPHRTYTLCGTPEYLAPELVLGRGHNKGVDYWALGVLIYEMVAGYSPFSANNTANQMQICRNIVSGRVSFPEWVNPNAREIIYKLLIKDPTKRMGCTNGRTAAIKQLKWFESTDWDATMKREITAPWIPKIENELDTSNFDPYEEQEEKLHYVDDGSGWDSKF